jgi:hypothetical protein
MDQREAEKRVDDLLGWFVHGAVYVAVLTLLATINIATWRGVPWALFAALGWGIGVAAHGLRVGALRLGRLEQWRRTKIDELMREPS